MKSCKAMKFQSRMSHKGSGKAVGEQGVKRGRHGMAMGETKAMSRQILKPKTYPHKQSSDGNGGK